MCLPSLQWDPSSGLFTGSLSLTTDSMLSPNTLAFNLDDPSQNEVSISLREIIDRFSNSPDIMDLLLKAKIEEDKRLTEQYRCKVEVALEETRQRELETLDQLHNPFELEIDSIHQENGNFPPVKLRKLNNNSVKNQPVVSRDSLEEAQMDNELLSKLEFDMNSFEFNEIDTNSVNPLKRKPTKELPIEYCLQLDPLLDSTNYLTGKNSPTNVTMETVQRKTHLQHIDKKERPQQKFMQMMRLVKHP
ncbi:hypothetical protein K7432_003082 [Basidiobolus ranarum]|uniref:Uncharacterized protein n=1 Tax=Basidiobolus ranarum TaxID=34480 RepID=A0ABR2X0F4_9FUNG